MESIDKWVFGLVTKLTLRWIKKNKYRKHKYNFFTAVTMWEMSYWIAGILFLNISHLASHHDWGYVVIFSFLIIFVATAESFKIKNIKDMANWYDTLWENRKNPQVYDAVKQNCELHFELGKKVRYWQLGFTILALIFLSIFDPWMFPLFLFFTFNIYHGEVFDMDEPPKKEKKVKSSVTDLVMGSWKNLIRTLQPSK